jgi:hypothetical protein
MTESSYLLTLDSILNDDYELWTELILKEGIEVTYS